MRVLIIVLTMLIGIEYSQAFEKCVDADGRVQYGDNCTLSDPVNTESIYIPDSYDPEADIQSQINTLELEQRTQQSAYERQKRNAEYRQNDARSDEYLSGLKTTQPTSKYRSKWQDKSACTYSESRNSNSNAEPCIKTGSSEKWHGPGGYIKLVDGNLRTPNGTYFASKR